MQYGAVRGFLDEHEKYVITAHETPDGDAIGSEYAMLRALQKLGKTAIIFNADPTPGNFAFLDATGEISVLKTPDMVPEDVEDYVLLVLDVNDTNNIGEVADWVLPKVKTHFIIDHHEHDNIIAGNLIEKSASSTGEILYQIFRELNVDIDLFMARALYAAIVYDTGSFIYPKTSALTFEIARDLVEIGVSPNEIYSQVYECKTVSFLNLQSRVFGTLEFAYNNRVAIQTMTKKIIEESGSSYEEGQQLINNPLNSQTVKVSIFFKENFEGLLRCSLRSKGNIDVARIATDYDGGGHKTAAGFKCSAGIDQTKNEVLEKLRIYFE
ncbi:MAG: bifunctional oligoribonuclease/PAP phosphatase NrnA [Spirochaetales bacterium]|nr:bifunctional oligoribonuclease/PAP phosphatase NrnA [Spirochaetales bacterium]MCF7939652.1 bifunctional oligoribonuclease/PAP phosphatase NrnA [Spirochaetales bacterium]